MDKKEWQKYAKETLGWDHEFSGQQYDIYKSGYRGIMLHDNVIMLADSRNDMIIKC